MSNIKSDLLRKVKILAAENDLGMNEVIELALEYFLEDPERRTKLQKYKEGKRQK